MHPKKTAEERKKEKESRRSRKARIILRNISYKTSEKNLTERFAKYGTIKECNILKRADGKLVGCAFIQYEKVNQAAKAIHHENAKEFLGRPVVIDWAVNRKKFTDHQKKSRKAEVKVENSDDDDDDDASIKSEPHSDEEDAEGDDSEAEESDSDAGSDDENDDDDDDDGDDDDTDEDEKDEKKPIHKRSNDVAEGCTVFIKNVPFEATSADLRKVCSQFGPLYYAVITTDKISGHSKGTGFVKYKVSSYIFGTNFNVHMHINNLCFDLCRRRNRPICALVRAPHSNFSTKCWIHTLRWADTRFNRKPKAKRKNQLIHVICI